MPTRTLFTLLAESVYTRYCRMTVSYVAQSGYSITEDLETLNWRNRPEGVAQPSLMNTCFLYSSISDSCQLTGCTDGNAQLPSRISGPGRYRRTV